MQELCSTWDMASMIIDYALQHPSIRRTNCEILMNIDKWEDGFFDLLKRRKEKYYISEQFDLDRKISGCKDMLYCLVEVSSSSFSTFSSAEDLLYHLLKIEDVKKVEYRMKPMPQFEYMQKKEDDQTEEDLFAKEARAKFARERDNLYCSEPLDSKEAAANQKELKIKKTEVESLKRHLSSSNARRETEAKRHDETVANLEARLKEEEDKEKCVLVAPSSNKRKHSQLISTPMSQANHIHDLVKSLFHFVVHLERKHERFFLESNL